MANFKSLSQRIVSNQIWRDHLWFLKSWMNACNTNFFCNTCILYEWTFNGPCNTRAKRWRIFSSIETLSSPFFNELSNFVVAPKSSVHSSSERQTKGNALLASLIWFFPHLLTSASPCLKTCFLKCSSHPAYISWLLLKLNCTSKNVTSSFSNIFQNKGEADFETHSKI